MLEFVMDISGDVLPSWLVALMLAGILFTSLMPYNFCKKWHHIHM
jgi:hypothetical protein